jgi:transglutaminase-like putative cysteine protease
MMIKRIAYIGATAMTVLSSGFCLARTIATPQVLEDFNKRKEIAVLQSKLSEVESLQGDELVRESMRFLYTYMQLPDITDYSVDFYVENMKTTERALSEMPWGTTVPDRELRHFVLPVRVNNEFLDESRMEFYEALKDRVKGLSMEDAILEVNHWCHELITYQPSDARTASPSYLILGATGRCGEESTFTVAALRSVGIPARQVYTPRWAHTDDNHAWVEAWANGKWYFLGACEPEPVLDLGWFNAPASRGMMVNTKVVGRYDGPEEVITRNSDYTTINVTSNYAPVTDVMVRVLDEQGKAVEGANVEFGLYNYAEFYSIARKESDSKGTATLRVGLGDMLVWCSKDGRYGWGKVSAGKDALVAVVLNHSGRFSAEEDINIVPPKGGGLVPQVSEAMTEQNNRRKEYEDSLRHAYMSKFYTEEEAVAVAEELKLDKDAMTRVLVGSRGNRITVEYFLTEMADKEKALVLLNSLNDKDLRDVRLVNLEDAILVGGTSSEDEINYLLNPRVENENLTPYKRYFIDKVPEKSQHQWQASPATLATWIAENIRADRSLNMQGIRMNAESVYECRVADPKSRDICFVKMARAMGIMAKIDPVNGAVSYYDATKGEWCEVNFNKKDVVSNSKKGVLKLSYEPHKYLSDPKYYIHFSLSRIDEEGRKHLLEYDEDATFNNTFASPVSLEEGEYMLVSGQRLASGEVLGHMSFFTIKEDETTEVPLTVRSDDNEISVIGQFNSEDLYYDIEEKVSKSILSTTGRGYYILGVISPNHEPSSHLLNEISAMRDEFEAYGKPVILLLPDESCAARFDASRFPNLPSNIRFGIDTTGAIRSEILESMHSDSGELPIVVVADTFNRIVNFSQGYSIGSANRVLDIIKRVE